MVDLEVHIAGSTEIASSQMTVVTALRAGKAAQRFVAIGALSRKANGRHLLKKQ